MDMILGKCKFQNSFFSLFSVKNVVGTHWNCLYEGCLKEVKTMDMILGKCKFKNSSFLIFSNICCRYTLELPH